MQHNFFVYTLIAEVENIKNKKQQEGTLILFNFSFLAFSQITL